MKIDLYNRNNIYNMWLIIDAYNTYYEVSEGRILEGKIVLSY